MALLVSSPGQHSVNGLAAIFHASSQSKNILVTALLLRPALFPLPEAVSTSSTVQRVPSMQPGVKLLCYTTKSVLTITMLTSVQSHRTYTRRCECYDQRHDAVGGFAV